MPSDGASHCMTIYDRGQPVFYGTIGLDWQAAGVAQVILSCAMSTLARSRSTISPTISSPDRRAWGRLAWIGSLAASRPLLRLALWAVRTISPCQMHSSCRRWRVLVATVAQPTDECWRRQCRHVSAGVTHRRHGAMASALSLSGMEPN